MSDHPHEAILGHIHWDADAATNERVTLRAPGNRRDRIRRSRFVRITDAVNGRTQFLGHIVQGPFFPETERADNSAAVGQIRAEIEIQGELTEGKPHETNNRPAPGSAVVELSPDEVAELLGFAGDMLLGCVSGRPDLGVRLWSQNKDVLPRNVGIFGTVGSGKSNSTQVLIEEVAVRGWAVIVIDVEGEYVEMDAPSSEERLFPKLRQFGVQPGGLEDFRVGYPASCTSARPDAMPFTLRLADFETSVIAEILQTTLPERNALLDVVDHFEQKARTKVATSEMEGLLGLLDPSPQAKMPFTLRNLRERAIERQSRSSEFLDYQGLATKLLWLMHSGVFDVQGMWGLNPAEMMKPGRVSVLDVSLANDTVKNLVTADLLRKTFAHKIAKEQTPPTLLVIEEAHSFISREKAHTMQATLNMLRNVTRRGRKRWLSVAFVSQQPGHLPPEIFELCNTRLVHTLRSMHNLDALMATTSDVTRELWARCPLLGTGEVVLSSPQLRRSAVVTVRPARSRRRLVH